MALSPTAIAGRPLADVSEPVHTRNDAFSFWKLPENWRSELEPTLAASEAAARHYLFEEYLNDRHRRPPSWMRAYYPIKNLIPRELRYFLNSVLIRARRQPAFPRWPCESALVDFWRQWLRESLALVGEKEGWHLGFWPGGKKCCIVLTHDVDSALGFERMERMAELEEKYGFVSAWNLPLDQYPLDWRRVEKIRARGFEFGAHGLCHDGQLFRSRRNFDQRAPKIERLAREHDLRGFRAPSTLRCGEWIATMAFDYDSSFSDTDPFEPQPGGTCSIFPFFMSEMVELPYTLPQDHTLIEVLKRDPLPIWTAKAHWIAALGGMILVLTHPDYCGAPPYLGKYEELLKRLRAIEDSWCVLPSAAAAWWRRRAKLRLFLQDAKPLSQGDESGEAVAMPLSPEALAL
jgi:hypothetical protein